MEKEQAMKLVDNAGEAYKWVSMHCMVLATALQGAWEMCPADLKAYVTGFVPPQYIAYATMSLLVLGMVGRLVKQGDA
jgi:hypothetical protein